MTTNTRRVLLAAGALILVSVVALLLQMATLPDVTALAQEDPTTTAFIARYQARLREQGRGSEVAWHAVPLSQISARFILAVLVSEDIGFFSHQGFELADLRNAMREAVTRRQAPRGASTITQQLAKNLWLSPSRNPLRKFKEALLTRRLERHLSKDRILELYLNVVEFGPGVYGAEAAAWRYFGKPAAELDDHEAALLAASLPRPSTWHPGSSSGGYLAQVAKIESRMARAVFLRQRLALPAVDTTTLKPDSVFWWDSLLPPESLLVPDSLVVPDTLVTPDSFRAPGPIPRPPDTIPRPAAGAG